jgi:putative membrane protein
MLISYAWAAYGQMGWLHVKLALVAILIGYHIWCGVILITFKHDRNRRTHVWYRLFNEVPVLFLVVIILLASLKPF